MMSVHTHPSRRLARGIVTMAFAFTGALVVATAIAIAMRPFLGPLFGGFVRSDEEGLNVPFLLGGYLLVCLVLLWLVPRVHTGASGWRHGATVGLALGAAVFLGDHLVTVGWSRMPGIPMLLSGLLDPLAISAAGIIVAVRSHGAPSGAATPS